MLGGASADLASLHELGAFTAAHVMLIRSCQSTSIRAWGPRIAERGSLKKAKIVVARKLAFAKHRMWQDETPFYWGAAALSDPEAAPSAGPPRASDKGPVREGDAAKAARMPGAASACNHASPPFGPWSASPSTANVRRASMPERGQKHDPKREPRSAALDEPAPITEADP